MRPYVSCILFIIIGLFIAFIPQPHASPPPIKTAAMATQPPYQARQTASISALVATPPPTPLPTIEPTPQPTTAPASIVQDDSSYYPTSGGIIGKVSFYSRAGCIGCSPNMITESGDPLDDNALTLAVVPGTFPMGQMVLVTNLSNSRQTVAKVNDTGGFAKYNRIADLSLALYTYLNARTDDSIILIEPVTK